MKAFKFSLLLVFNLIAYSMIAQLNVINIWPNLAPGSEDLKNTEEWRDGKSVINVYQPELTVFLPDNVDSKTPAILICPGGGYRQVVMEKEGYKIAKWLNDNNIAAFVLKYRLEPTDALRDAQRAISVLRSNASLYNIDENKIGVIGFSAGAHLSCNLAMHFQHKKKVDRIDDFSSKPNFWVGIYGSYGNFSNSQKKYEASNLDIPTLLIHAGNDSKVPVSSSIEMYKYLHEKGAPVELHVYEQGEHGFALETNRGMAITSTVHSWSQRCIEWMKVKGKL